MPYDADGTRCFTYRVKLCDSRVTFEIVHRRQSDKYDNGRQDN